MSETKWAELGITFSMIPMERYEDVVSFAYANFYPDEPISRSLGICQPGGPRNKLMDKFYIEDALKDEVSMMATDAENQIVAIRIGKVVRKSQPQPLPSELNSTSWLLPFLPKAYAQFFYLRDLFKRMNYDVERAFDLLDCDIIYEDSILSTAKKCRIKGLGTELVRRSLEIGKAAGCEYIYTISSGEYSSKIFLNLYFSMDNEYCYNQLKDPRGQQILQDTREHTKSMIFHKKLNV